MATQHVTPSRLARVRTYIRKESRDKGPGWLGIAPSYLVEHAGVVRSYYAACAILLALEAEGFLVDTGHGGPLERPDGRVGTNRFSLTAH
jgi:hypothetical protein